jgi:hypothetical protein
VQISRFKITEDYVFTCIFIQAHPEVSLEGGGYVAYREAIHNLCLIIKNFVIKIIPNITKMFVTAFI